MNPKYPIFIPTKGRSKTPYTIKAFKRIGVKFKAVIEAQELKEYSTFLSEKEILVLPHRDKGLTVTRNWIWDYALKKGYKRFWTFDDNITDFYRLNRNIKWRMRTPTFLRVIEDFVDRYENIVIAGMQYEMFIPRKTKVPPFIINTRIYSNMLIQTDAKDKKGDYFRNECFYNDDTDLCLRVLKDGFCTIQFHAFLADKIATMKLEGGMTTYYKKDGRLKFAEELVDKHPDVAKVTWKFNRWHHQVNYKPFKRNKLILKKSLVIPNSINNFGMILKTLKNK